MDDTFDPTHGELRVLVGWLDAAQAEMMTSDLRDLKIPARMRQQVVEEIDPTTGATVTRDTGAFEILVPEAFVEIAHEVMDVTHLQREGDATTAEILADLADPAVIAAAVPDPKRTLLKRVDSAGTRLTLVALVVGGVALLVAVWQVLRAFY